ncbi:MAG: HAD-IC family P-type ATPase, partial [Chloroflexi bacterium]|nr:HAD-IC family P-type ATPase [Chloroflexota bacterium]
MNERRGPGRPAVRPDRRADGRSTAACTMPNVAVPSASTESATPGPAAAATTAALDPLGLTEAEVEARRAAGQGNTAPPPTTRTYVEIISENVFTFVNNVLGALAIALMIVGRPLDALVSLGVIGTNVVVAIYQEIKAKRALDEIALLAAPTARVIREGGEHEIKPELLVIGDLVRVTPGDQIVLDGELVAGEIELDESALTGESDAVHRAPGDPVHSGTYCVSGFGSYAVQAVGEASLANRITAGARGFRRILTPLQKEINLVIRFVLAIVVYLQLLIVLEATVAAVSPAEAVGQATILAGLVPNGLFVSIAIAYALAAIRISRLGALIQQSNAVESLSHVDALCLDKTGTITAGEFVADETFAPDGGEAAFRATVGSVVASMATRNRTAEAIARACPGEKRTVTHEVPFSSLRRWSGVVFADGDRPGLYALGAFSSFAESVRPADAAERDAWERCRETAHRWATEGRRVLVLAWHGQPGERIGERDPELPVGVKPLGLISLRDVLRQEASSTLERFAKAGVRVRIISGDDPETVATLVRQAGVRVDRDVMSGAQLEGLDDAAFREAVERGQVFGRVSPPLKERIVDELRDRGHYVAMVGDGVNDVLSLKKAHLAVAMGSGSQATRGVADLILLDDSFSALAAAVEEGNRIRNGMHGILRLFLTRISTMGLVIISSLVVGYFPIELRNASAITLFTVGVPSVLLAAWAPPGRRLLEPLVRTLRRFVVPAAIVSSIVGLGVFYGTLILLSPGTGALTAPPETVSVARSALTTFLVMSGLLLVVFVAPPAKFFAVVEPVTPDQRPALLAVALAL